MIGLQQLLNLPPLSLLFMGLGLGLAIGSLLTLLLSSNKNRGRTSILESIERYVEKEVERKIEELSGFMIEMNTETVKELMNNGFSLEEKINVQENVIRQLVEANNNAVQDLKLQKQMIVSWKDELIDDVNAMRQTHPIYTSRLTQLDEGMNTLYNTINDISESIEQRETIMAGYEKMIEEHKEIIETNFRVIAQYQAQVEEAKQRRQNGLNNSPTYAYPPHIPGSNSSIPSINNGTGLSNLTLQS